MGLFGPPSVKVMKDMRDVEGLIKVLRYNRTLSVKENVHPTDLLSGGNAHFVGLVSSLAVV